MKNESSPLSFNVELDDGQIVRRHIDLIQSYGVSSIGEQIIDTDSPTDITDKGPQPQVDHTQVNKGVLTPPLQRSGRLRIAPERYRPESP